TRPRHEPGRELAAPFARSRPRFRLALERRQQADAATMARPCDYSRRTEVTGVAERAKQKSVKTMAEEADIHELYEQSVQAVDVEVEFLRDTFRALRGREAQSFREDFCGTAALSCEWAQSASNRYSVG